MLQTIQFNNGNMRTEGCIISILHLKLLGKDNMNIRGVEPPIRAQDLKILVGDALGS